MPTRRNIRSKKRTTRKRPSTWRTRSRKPSRQSTSHGLADRTIKKAGRTIDIPVSWYWSTWGHVIKYKAKRWEYAGLFHNRSEIHEKIERQQENSRNNPAGWRYEYMLFKTPAKYHLAPWALYYRLYRLNPDTKRWNLFAPWGAASYHVR